MLRLPHQGYHRGKTTRGKRKALLHIRWQGARLKICRSTSLAAPDRVRYPEALLNRVRLLVATMTDAQITATLNQEGLLSAKGKPFTPSMVSWIDIGMTFQHRL